MTLRVMVSEKHSNTTVFFSRRLPRQSALAFWRPGLKQILKSYLGSTGLPAIEYLCRHKWFEVVIGDHLNLVSGAFQVTIPSLKQSTTASSSLPQTW